MHRARHYIEFPPVVAYDKIFVAQQRGRFYALDAKTGKQRWTKNFRRCAAASPTVWRGVVYQVLMHELPCRKHQAGATGLLIAMNARTGRELWSFRPGAIESSPLIVDGVIFFGSWDHYVYAIDVRTKKVKWRFRTDDQVVAGPAYSHGTIYIPSSSGHLYAINAWTGRERWRASSFSRFGRREYFYATPTVAYGRVFIGNADGYVYSYGAKSGNLIWAQRAGTYVYTAAAVWRKTVYVGTWDGWVVAFDAATGRTRWRHDSPGGVSGAPTVMDGLLYYATLGGFGGRHQRRVEPGAQPDLRPRRADREARLELPRRRLLARRGRPRPGLSRRPDARLRPRGRRTPPRPQSDSVREVQRYAPTAIVLALLAATAVAFVTTQRQKLEPSPVGRIAVDPVLSPVCGCDKSTASILIGLRRTDTVTLDLVSSAGTRGAHARRRPALPRATAR